MSDLTAIPILTYDDLIRRAVEDWGAVTNIAYTKNLTATEANIIASRAVTSAVNDWIFETGRPFDAVPWAMQVTAMAAIVDAGWDEWEREQQMDLFEDQDIWRGAAAHEARRDLG